MVINLLTILCLILFIFLSPGYVKSQELAFKSHGNQVRKLSVEQLEELVGAETITVFEPHEGENRRYKGFPVREILTAVYGKDWKGEEEILFTCADGYQPSVPSVKFKTYESYLVYATTMPALNPDADDRDEIIKDIIAYLKAMRDKKVEPVTKKR